MCLPILRHNSVESFNCRFHQRSIDIAEHERRTDELNRRIVELNRRIAEIERRDERERRIMDELNSEKPNVCRNDLSYGS